MTKKSATKKAATKKAATKKAATKKAATKEAAGSSSSEVVTHVNERGPGRRGAYAGPAPKRKPKLTWRAIDDGEWFGGGGEHGGQPLVVTPAGVSSPWIISIESINVHAIDDQGRRRWGAELISHSGFYAGALAVHDDLLLVASNKALFALDLKTGEQRWQRNLPRPHGGAATDGRHVYVGAAGGVLALRPEDGKTAWKWTPKKKAKEVEVPIVAAGDRLIVAVDEELVALSCGEDGPRELWCALGIEYHTSRYGVAVDGDLVYAALQEGVAAYHLEDGKRSWLTKGRVDHLAVDHARVVASGRDNLLALDKQSGKKLFSEKGNFGVPALADDTCVCTFTDEDYDCGLVAINLANGKRRWFISHYDFRATNRDLEPNLNPFSVPLLLDGKIIVGSYGVCAFG